jgi:toxin FitB
MSRPLKRNVVDSSGWIEYFANSRRARLFAKPIEATDQLVVPVLSIYEVFKKVLRERGEEAALRAAACMELGTVVDIDMTLCLDAARLTLPLADSILYATARAHDALFWTQDEHFRDIQGVKYFAK